MFITIIIATRNRATDLARTVLSICTRKNLQFSDWEVIVVDNGSTDRTNEVCREYGKSFPRHFRYIEEKKLGKSNAVNTAFQSASGDVVAMIDDDVICQSDYLEGIRNVFSSGFSEIVQGRIFVDYHSKRPKWFKQDVYFDQMMLLSDLGDQRCELQRSLWGANIVVPAAAIAKVGGFCPELGAGANGFGEDAEFDHRLRHAGYRIIYSPEIVVRHQVTSERLNIKFVLSRSLKIGLCSASYSPPPRVALSRYTLYLIKCILLEVPLMVVDLGRSQRGRAIRRACAQLQQIGFVAQHWRFKIYGQPRLNIPSIQMVIVE